MDPASISGELLFDLAWINEPTAWVGLLTLTVMQVILGLDNLLFIAILSSKLPPRQSRSARYIGLGGSLVIRLILMFFAAYIIAMKEPLFSFLVKIFPIEIYSCLQAVYSFCINRQKSCMEN